MELLALDRSLCGVYLSWYAQLFCTFRRGPRSEACTHPGLSAFNSGVTPESGLSYSNLFLFYSRDHLKGPGGEVLATGKQSVLMDMNFFRLGE